VTAPTIAPAPAPTPAPLRPRSWGVVPQAPSTSAEARTMALRQLVIFSFPVLMVIVPRFDLVLQIKDLRGVLKAVNAGSVNAIKFGYRNL
jgi:hypothetical protein